MINEGEEMGEKIFFAQYDFFLLWQHMSIKLVDVIFEGCFIVKFLFWEYANSVPYFYRRGQSLITRNLSMM